VDSRPSRRAVRRTQASSGEWPAAPDARRQPLELLFGHHGIDLLDPSGRPGADARPGVGGLGSSGRVFQPDKADRRGQQTERVEERKIIATKKRKIRKRKTSARRDQLDKESFA
jgi:hypothetical protein